MSIPFGKLYAYEKKKWNKGIEQKAPVAAAGPVAPVDEEDRPNYAEMSRSELYKAAKALGWDKPWIESNVDALTAYMEENA